MPATALILVLTAAFAHAGWNLASKRAGGSGARFVWLTSTGAAILMTPFAIGALPHHLDRLAPWILAGAVSGLIHSAYTVTLQRGYASGDISVVYPLARGTGPALSVALAVILFHEWPGPLGLIGAGVVILGVLIIALSSRPGAGGRHHPLAGVVLGIATGLLIACYTLWDAHAVTGVGVYPITMMWLSSVTQTACLAPFAWRDRGRLATVFRRFRWEALVVSVLSPVAYILVLFALQRAPVSLVAPTREVSVVLVSISGSLLFGEPALARRVSGAVVVLAGVACLAVA